MCATTTNVTSDATRSNDDILHHDRRILGLKAMQDLLLLNPRSSTSSDPLSVEDFYGKKEKLSYMDHARNEKSKMVDLVKDICMTSMKLLLGGDGGGEEEDSHSMVSDVIQALVPHETLNHSTSVVVEEEEEPHEEPDQQSGSSSMGVHSEEENRNDHLYPLSFVPVENEHHPTTLEDNVIRAMLSTPTKTGGEYRALRAALCQTHSKKEINEMLKKWQVVEADDGEVREEDLHREASKRLRINADEFRAALYDYNVLTSSNTNRLVQANPHNHHSSRKRRQSTSSIGDASGGRSPKRRGIVQKYKNLLLQEFIRTNGNFTISEAVLWLKQNVTTLEDEDFPSDKQIRGYVSILRMANKKTGTIPSLKAAMI